MNNSNLNHTILYRYFDADDQLLYIGITNNQARRFSQHKDKDWFRYIHRATFEHFSNRKDAELAEMMAIKKELPLHNISHHPEKERTPDKITIWFHTKLHLVQMLNEPDGGHDEIHKDWAEEVKSWLEPHECWDLPWDAHLAHHLFAYELGVQHQLIKPFKAHQECQQCSDIFVSDWYEEQATKSSQIFDEAGQDYWEELRQEVLNEH